MPGPTNIFLYILIYNGVKLLCDARNKIMMRNMYFPTNNFDETGLKAILADIINLLTMCCGASI